MTSQALEKPRTTLIDPNKCRKYTPAQVEVVLRTLAVLGSPKRTAEALAARDEDPIEVDPNLLIHWRDTIHPDAYRQIVTELSPQIEEDIATSTREVALAAGKLQHELMDDLAAKRGSLDAKDIASALRNVATTQGIAVDKLLSMTGRPGTIVEHRPADEILRALAAKGYIEPLEPLEPPEPVEAEVVEEPTE